MQIMPLEAHIQALYSYIQVIYQPIGMGVVGIYAISGKDARQSAAKKLAISLNHVIYQVSVLVL